MDLKAKLLQLIKNSPTLQSLPAEELKFRTEAMLNADEAGIMNFITILENEAVAMKKIDNDYAAQADDINNLVEEANQLEKEAENLVRKDIEADERSGDEAAAENLLGKLDDVSK